MNDLPMPRRVSEAFQGPIRVLPGSRGVVALSGGPDSLCLAHCLAGLAAARGWDLVAAHVDHGLRAESAVEAAMASSLAERLGLRFVNRRVALEADRGNLQERAREARRATLLQLASELEAEWIALGHTASDQAETVLMRVLRGTGLRGLRGMAWQSGPWIRPLLGVDRATVEQYLAHHELVPVREPTNESDAYLRNRVRRRILPLLAEENPRVVEALCRLARTSREEDRALEAEARRALRRADHDGALSVEELGRWPTGVLHRALRRAYARARGSARGLSRRHVEALARLAACSDGSAVVDLPGVRAVRTYGALRLERSEPDPGPQPDASVARRLQEGRFEWSGRELEVVRAPAPAAPLSGEWVRAPGRGEVYELRGPRLGDRLRLGEQGRKKVARLLMEARVPRRERSSVPILVAGEEVALVPGHRTGHGRLPAPGESAWRVRLLERPS
ncbi:MAG: tRNA lysidine(34) synthetase TilS [Deltaproteobacteria bacterium]|nr:tRNA lysidine(34) synthetase TilS [Deltaproteobacteria bacterium]